MHSVSELGGSSALLSHQVGDGGIALDIPCSRALTLCVSHYLFYFIFYMLLYYIIYYAAGIFSGVLLRPPPGCAIPGLTEKKKAQNFILQFLLQEDASP